MIDLTTLIDLVSKGGTLVVLLLAIAGGWKGWYVWKVSHDFIVKILTDQIEDDKTRLHDMTVDRDFWRDQAIKALMQTSRAVSAVKQTQESS